MTNSYLPELFIPFNERNEYQRKIGEESRKRVQAYSMVDFFTSSISYFDFFSRDMFDLVQQSKILVNELEEEIVYLDHFLYLLASPRKIEPLALTCILNSYGITIKSLSDSYRLLPSSAHSLAKTSSSFSIKTFFDSNYYKFLDFLAVSNVSESFLEIFTEFENEIDDSSIEFSRLVWQLFEKSAENAAYRFKTAVITPEIFFITMMEEKNKRIGKIIRSFVPNEIDWLVLRFKLIKRAYFHESLIRQKIKRKYLPFTYLYKRSIPEISFDQFLSKDDKGIEEIVVTFRNTLISEMISSNFNEYLETDLEDTLKSLRKFGYQRHYSF